MKDELRNLPTVAAGITLDEQAGPHSPRTIVYCPGNGTRYVLFLTLLSLSDQAAKELGCERSSWLVSPRYNRRPMLLSADTDYLHWSYVGEHMGYGPPDAVVVAELLGYLTDRPAMSCDEYRALMAADPTG